MSDLHPIGEHEAEVLDHGLVTSKTGTSGVAVKFQTEFDVITGWFYLTDKTVEYTIEKLRAMGWEGDDFRELNQQPAVLAGHKCVITVSHESYEGKTRAKVNFVNPEGYEGGEIQRDENAAKNAMRFNALLKSGKGKVKPSTAKPPKGTTVGDIRRGTGAPVTNDELDQFGLGKDAQGDADDCPV